MLTIWGRKSSSNVQAVMWCIAELKLPVNRIDAGFNYGVTGSEEYLSMNPNGTVPTLQDGGNPPVWESGAILRYLARNYASPPFWPSDAIEKTQVDMWAEWSKLNIACEFTTPVFWPAVRIPAKRRNLATLENAVLHLESNLKIADAKLRKSEYLAGDNFSLADIQFGHVLYRYYDINIDRANDLQNVARYYHALEQRPAYQEHVMISYEELVDSM